jgi:hypothetical protein
VTKLEQPLDPLEAAEAVLPFGVDASAAQSALRAWMRTLGFFRPSDLATRSTIDRLRPLWWAAWIFDAEALVSWSADSNAGARSASWAPHAGQAPMTFANVLVTASRGLTARECNLLTPYFNLASAGPPAASASAWIERFDVQRAAARSIVADAIHATAVGRLKEGTIPGSRFRNVHAAVLLRGLRTRRMALPTYVLAYEYDGRLYRALVHGQDARIVIGDAPYSIAKILLVIGAALAIIAIVVAAIALYAYS